jgi:hypothetical protein
MKVESKGQYLKASVPAKRDSLRQSLDATDLMSYLSVTYWRRILTGPRWPALRVP